VKNCHFLGQFGKNEKKVLVSKFNHTNLYWTTMGMCGKIFRNFDGTD